MFSLLKRYVIPSVAALTLVTLLAGCSVGPSASTDAATTAEQQPSASPPTTAEVPTTSSTPKPARPEIIMASTTSTRDSGLMDVLIPMFEKQTGYRVKPVYVGTGAAIAMGQQGNADVVLVHSPAQEVQFVQSGAGINRRLVMHNDFILIGPVSDPAGVRGLSSATDALRKIADAGASFYSRGDASGTDTLEKGLWKKIGISVADNSTTNPDWYIQGGAGTGMLDLLRVCSEKKGYTITDRATYVANRGVLSLDIMVQGDPALLNVYHVIQVNPAMFPAVNKDGALAFSNFLMSKDAQLAISQYGNDKYGEPLFYADGGKTDADYGLPVP